MFEVFQVFQVFEVTIKVASPLLVKYCRIIC